MSSSADSQLATLLDALGTKYRMLHEIGQGGMALVYLAEHRTSGERVAVKIIRPQLLQDQESLDRLRREAEVARRMSHENIVRLRSVEELPLNGLALVMDYVEGGTLKAFVRERGQLPIPQAFAVLRDIGEALRHAHASGIVHRDIKPDNVFLSARTGRALLGDFGIAHETGEHTISIGNEAVGTPSYMSPEQIDGRALDARSDLYSLGCVAWELFSGQQPWQGYSIVQVLNKQKHEHLQPLRQLRPDIPSGVDAAISKCLDKDPQRRFASAGDFLAALRGEKVREHVRIDMRKPRHMSVRSQRTVVVALVIVGALALVEAGMQMASSPPSPVMLPETKVDASVRTGQREVGVRDLAPTAQSRASGARTDGPATATVPTSAYTRDGEAQAILRMGQNIETSFFSRVPEINALAQNGQVNPALRVELRKLASKARDECLAMKEVQADLTCP